jgi:hypothetical protein
MPTAAYAPARNAFGTKEAALRPDAPSLPAPAAQPTQLADQQGGETGPKAVSVLGAPIRGDMKWKAGAVLGAYGTYTSRGLTRLGFLALTLYSLKMAKAG